MPSLQQKDDFILILVIIYSFVDDFVKEIVKNLQSTIECPGDKKPPVKKHKLSFAELVTLAIFYFFTGHRNRKDFYRHIKTYHKQDFPDMPTYNNFNEAVNRIAWFSTLILEFLMDVFRKMTGVSGLKMADASKLKVCEIKREFTHKVCKGMAKKSKSTMGWFYGFKLHLICNELMHILSFAITPGNTDDRKGLDMIWNDILGMIIADAGYIGKDWMKKAQDEGKHLFTAVKANMKKLMTKAQHNLLKMRQKVEAVFSVLKLRFGMETTLPRSPLGYLPHYLWCITAYQLKKFFELLIPKPSLP